MPKASFVVTSNLTPPHAMRRLDYVTPPDVTIDTQESDCNLLVINNIKNSIGGKDPPKKLCRLAPNET